MSSKEIGLTVLIMIGVFMVVYEELVSIPRTRRRADTLITAAKQRLALHSNPEKIIDAQIKTLQDLFSGIVNASHKLALAGVLLIVLCVVSYIK